MNLCKFITIAGQKGGIGKSVTSVNLAASLALLEKRTLLVDCDPQARSSAWAGIKSDKTVVGLHSVLSGRTEPVDAVSATELKFLDIIPSDFNLFFTSLRVSRNSGNEKLLQLFLKDLDTEYQYIILDSPSSFGFLSISAMAAAEWLVLPFSFSASLTEEISRLLKTVKFVKENFQPELKIAGFLCAHTHWQSNSDELLCKHQYDDIREILYSTHIPYDINITRAGDSGIPVSLYDLDTNGARAYLDFAWELDSFFK